jgi:hypothetical protein
MATRHLAPTRHRVTTRHRITTRPFAGTQPSGGAHSVHTADQTDRSSAMFPLHESLSRARIRPAPEVRYRAVPRPARVVAAEAAARRSRENRG